MFAFRLQHLGKTHSMALVSLHPIAPRDDINSRDYYVSAGAYDQNGRYQGVSVQGNVPIPEFIQWAIRKGFLQWEVDPKWGDAAK